ncbi:MULTISPECIES: hypothetical protein [Streptomyces]|uniref:hypothetical protein n=1 Tax=Streptomyces TaxID=1883 RepID=UPI002ED18008|nr:hypothetical protein OHB17_42995 [Streptomyces sp. NBC_00724]
MNTTTALAVLYNFVIHDVAGNLAASLVLLTATASWRRLRVNRQIRHNSTPLNEPETPPDN